MRSQFFRRAAAILAAGAMLMQVSASVPGTAETAPDTYHDDWLHVENAQIVDMYGNPVWMTGCNWFGYNVGSQVFDGVWSQNMHSMLNQIADHGFNLLRVPMSSGRIMIRTRWSRSIPMPTRSFLWTVPRAAK